MAGKYYSGKDGVVTFNGQRVAKVASWSLSGQIEPLEVTSLEDSAREYVPGIQSATGSATIWMHRDNAASATAAAPLLDLVLRTTPLPEDTTYSMGLIFDDQRLVFNCVVTAAELSCNVGAVMQAAISFTVTGPFTEVVL